MRTPRSVRAAEAFGRTRLSPNFFMREFLFSEIAAMRGMTNMPSDPASAAQAGGRLCELLLEPLQATFGRLSLRSGYRSPEVNAYGNAHSLGCASNARDQARHIWDQRDDEGCLGAMVTVVVPWLLDRLHGPITWQSMAWWIHDNLPYSELQFFPKLCAFNIAWREAPRRRIHSFVPPRGVLTRPGMPNHDGDHRDFYRGFPALAGGAPPAAPVEVSRERRR